MTNYLAIAGLILVTIIWGGGFVASDMALESLTPFQIMAIRFFLGTVLMGLISIKDLKGMKRKEIMAGICMGIALFIAFALQIIGLQYTTPSKNAFITALNVVMVPFIAFVFLHKKVSDLCFRICIPDLFYRSFCKTVPCDRIKFYSDVYFFCAFFVLYVCDRTISPRSHNKRLA